MYIFSSVEEGNQENGLVINRNGELKTLSITQSIIEKNKVTILHHDLIAQEDFSTSFITISTTLKLLLHKVTHWEYWPFQVVYIPIYFLWAFMLSKQNPFFFNASNPTIKTEDLLWNQKKQFII
jgi:hypothetical protein